MMPCCPLQGKNGVRGNLAEPSNAPSKGAKQATLSQANKPAHSTRLDRGCQGDSQGAIGIITDKGAIITLYPAVPHRPRKMPYLKKFLLINFTLTLINNSTYWIDYKI